MSRALFLTLLLSATGCTQFHTGRSFLSAMENDDSRFFHPSDDFPVVAGDSGRFWNTDDEQKRRTPASEQDLVQSRSQRLLSQELRDLEQSESEEGQNFYENHRHQLQTTSEKIYFLKLPHHERRDYLMSRGFIKEQASTQVLAQPERMFGLRKQEIQIGMTKTDVAASWGKPVKVEFAGNPQNENERWLYKMNGAPKYIYFEAGQVQGWE